MAAGETEAASMEAVFAGILQKWQAVAVYPGRVLPLQGGGGRVVPPSQENHPPSSASCVLQYPRESHGEFKRWQAGGSKRQACGTGAQRSPDPRYRR